MSHLKKSFGKKRDFIRLRTSSHKSASTTYRHRLICHLTNVQTEERLGGQQNFNRKNQFYASFYPQPLATFHFWNLKCYCVVLRKLYLTYCLAQAPCYTHIWKKTKQNQTLRKNRAKSRVIPGTCEACPCLENTHQELWQCQCGILPCPYPDTWGQHGSKHRAGKEWQTSELIHSQRPGREKNVGQSRLLLSLCHYLMITEQDVLCGVKRGGRIYCPNKSQTGHLCEMGEM